jgi:uncharacterized membrane protein
METVLNVLHVVGAVFVVGPMAILPMSGLRAIRSGHAAQAASLAKLTFIFALVSLLVVVFGFGVMGMSDPKYHLSVTTPWILASLILYVIAAALLIFVTVPAMRRAATAEAKAGYGAIAGSSGIASLALLAVVVLMVWKP